jgi:glucose-6-phosphate dehydrogenase assembly protein OpcA
MTDLLQRFERGDAIEVPLGRIEPELAALWRQAAQPRPGETPRAVTRASLWNLVVRVQGEERFIQVKGLIDELSLQVPARVIVLRAESDAPSSETAPIRAWVEANWRRQAGHAIGSDEVTLLACGDAVERMSSLVRSLLVTDAPTALLWVGGPRIGLPLPNVPLNGLLGEVDRFIVDSRQLPSDAMLLDLHRISEEMPSLQIADLAWMGVRPLRGLCAALFDPPHDPSVLAVLERARVTSGVAGTQTRALLTLGWLASRLGWRDFKSDPQAGDLRRWRATRPDAGEVVLELATDLGGANHGVVGLTLEARGRTWSLERDHTCIDVRAPDQPRRMQPARSHSDAELLVAALGARGRDRVFPAALASAAHLVGAP